jgi:ribosomal protein S18 acetylase RimI-like enzyme
LNRGVVEIRRGLPSGLEAQAAALYWEAFGAKLDKLMGPAARGIAFFEDTVNPQAIIAALDNEGGLLGIAAFRIGKKGFSFGGPSALFKHYGPGALWRLVPLAMLERNAPGDTLQMDGICVDRAARGVGVGTALFDELFTLARQAGFTRITLDVIDSNPRAKALYERLGFRAVSEESTSFLRPLLGFRSATRMLLAL